MSEYEIGNRDPRSMGKFYTKHISAMTEEGLYEKSDIAAELAWRDMQLAEAKLEIERFVERKYDAYEKLPHLMNVVSDEVAIDFLIKKRGFSEDNAKRIIENQKLTSMSQTSRTERSGES